MKTLSSRVAKHLFAVALAGTAFVPAAQAGALDLSRYSIAKASWAWTPEAGAITYNQDRNSLFVIGDEAAANEYNPDGTNYQNVLDVSLMGGYKDPEGVTYVGNNRYVIASERTGALYLTYVETILDYGPGGIRPLMKLPDPAHTFTLDGGGTWGNQGLEGVSYDPITGGFFAVKEVNNQGIFFIDWDFNTPNAVGTQSNLFDPALLGLETLSDIATLSTVAAFDSADFRGNLLILSATSKKLVEVTRSGTVVSEFDLSNILSPDGYLVDKIEGVTLDDAGNIYLAAELGSSFGGRSSTLIKLTAPAAAAVPEPATWAMLIGGFALAGASMRRRKTAVAFA